MFFLACIKFQERKIFYEKNSDKNANKEISNHFIFYPAYIYEYTGCSKSICTVFQAHYSLKLTLKILTAGRLLEHPVHIS